MALPPTTGLLVASLETVYSFVAATGTNHLCIASRISLLCIKMPVCSPRAPTDVHCSLNLKLSFVKMNERSLGVEQDDWQVLRH